MHEEQPLVLIVDDNATNIDLLVSTLRHEYRLGVAKQGSQALTYAEKYQPDLILLDIMMPEMNGFEVITRLKRAAATCSIPVIFITAMQETVNKTRGFELGAVDYITKPFHGAEVRARVRNHICLLQMKKRLEEHNQLLTEAVEEKTAELSEMLNGTINSMAMLVEIRDPYTAGHQQRVAHLASRVAERMGLEAGVVEGLRIAGLLHDVGKIRVPVSILSRAGALLDAELEVIKIHPQVGFEILQPIAFPRPVAEMVLQHHERLDGSGYPRGLQEADIMLEAKILAVVDVAEAYSSFRPYRPAQGMKAAARELREGRGRLFDVAATDACLEVLHEEQLVTDAVNGRQ